MGKKLSILIAACLVLLTYGNAQETAYIKNQPSETVVLNLPGHMLVHWKEISRNVNEKMGVVELIPVHQTAKDWSELICIQYYHNSAWSGIEINAVEVILDQIKATTIVSYPGKKVTWNIIEKSGNSVIYEWVLHERHENTPPQQEVSRCFLTKQGYHCISFTRRKGQMSSDERNQWITLLKESSSIIPMQKQNDTPQGLSLADRLKNSLELGSAFQDWRENHTFQMENGYTLVCHLPPSQTGSYITECLEVFTTPNISGLSLEQFYELDRKRIQENSSKKIEFDVLKKTPKEIVYSYFHPKGNLQVTVVTRAFTTNLGYYCINYMKALALKKADVLQWKDRLDLIKVKDEAKPF